MKQMINKITNIAGKYYKTVIGVFVMYIILCLTLHPIDIRMTVTDSDLVFGIIVLSILVIATYGIKGFQKRHCDACLDFGWSDLFVLAWFVYFLCRVWLLAEFPCATDAVKGVTMFATYFILRLFFSFYHLSCRLLIVGLLMFCGYEVILGISQLIGGSSNHMLYLMTGTFYNPGPYSAYLTLGAVIILSLLHSDSDGMYLLEFGTVSTKYIYCVILGLILLVLPATWSRSAFMALGILCLWIYRDKYRKYRYYLCGMIVFAVVGMYYLKKGSADGRLMIWLSSLTSWKHSPLIGTGIGSFFNAEAEGTSELYRNHGYMTLFDSADITNFMCNDYLKILLEQGIIGALFCALAAIALTVKLHAHSKSLCYGVVALLIFSMTSYPFELLPYKLILVLIAAWGNSQPENGTMNDIGEVICKPLSQFRCMHCLVWSGLIMLMCIFLKNETDRRVEAEQSFHLFNSSGQEAFIDDYYELLPLEHDNSYFLFDFAKLLRTFGRYRDSNAILQKGTLVSNDPMFYILIGNNYRDMQFYDLSETSYKKAYSIMPNRLYPLYQLMNLYLVIGDKAKARKMARRVVDFREKVTSPATNEMKDKAKQILSANI